MRTDLTKLKQCLINLLSNAAKFTEKGEVTLTVARQTGPEGRSHVMLQGVGQRHRHDRGADGPAVPGVRAGRFLDHPELRRHRPWPHHHQALLPPCWAARSTSTSTPGEGSTFTMDLPDQPGDHGMPRHRNPEPVASGGGRRRRSPCWWSTTIRPCTTCCADAREGRLSRHARARRRRGAGDRCARRRRTSSRSTCMMPKVDGWSVLAEHEVRSRAARTFR